MGVGAGGTLNCASKVAGSPGVWGEGVLFAASVDGVLLAASVDGVLRAASVGRTLSPSAYVVVLLKSDFLAYYC
jgi:hypothetical protein